MEIVFTGIIGGAMGDTSLKETYKAHTSDDGRPPQLLQDHLKQVAQMAAEFAKPIHGEDMAYWCGLFHDLGKYSEQFQKYIRGTYKGKVDHSTAGAQFVWNRQKIYKFFSLLGALCIAGHHAGIPDFGTRVDPAEEGTLFGRMKRDIPDYQDGVKSVSVPDTISASAFEEILRGNDAISILLFVRMIFSCLVDADFLDTEAYMSGGRIQRGGFTPLADLGHRFFEKLKEKGYLDPQSKINHKRVDILKRCMEAGEGKPGVYTLTVPTGGGKTMSSFAFAMKHAMTHGKRRIIYAIPYTSIIEQTAAVFRDFLGDEDIIEAHSQVDYDDASESMSLERLAAENWDAPVIVTTNVQFFESLFANRTSRCRKLHNIAGSVIVLDEAQMLPVEYMKPVLKALDSLAAHFQCTVVLCSATQPHLERICIEEKKPILQSKEIMKDIPDLYEFFKRVQFKDEGKLDYEEIGRRLARHEQVLCIAGTKDEARKIYEEVEGEGTFYLSTNLCPVHRRRVIEEIKMRLREGQPCRVVSTSIISVGVDIDFPAVYLELSGLDSLIQGAGRCNREGKRTLTDSTAHVFSTDKIMESRFMKQERQVMAHVQQRVSDISSPEAIAAYFKGLYEAKDGILDKKKVINLSKKMAFAEIGRSVKLIEDHTKSVFIPYTDDAKVIEESLRLGIRTRELMRKAGKYMVSVRSGFGGERTGDFEWLCRDGYADPLDENLAILTRMDIYDETMGFAYHHQEGQAEFL